MCKSIGPRLVHSILLVVILPGCLLFAHPSAPNMNRWGGKKESRLEQEARLAPKLSDDELWVEKALRELRLRAAKQEELHPSKPGSYQVKIPELTVIRKIHVQGNRKLPRSFIIWLSGLTEGNRFRYPETIIAQLRLTNSQLFREADVALIDPESGKKITGGIDYKMFVDYLIVVEESIPVTVSEGHEIALMIAIAHFKALRIDFQNTLDSLLNQFRPDSNNIRNGSHDAPLKGNP